MLNNNFFKILAITHHENKKSVEVEIDKNHAVFQGHFPGNPVVPGVFLIQMVKEIVEEIESKKLRILKADEIKFINLVVPQIYCNLLIEIEPRKQGLSPYSYNILVSAPDIVLIKMKIEFIHD